MKILSIALLFAAGTLVMGQWLDYPTPSIPRTGDGKR
jgi:hypothetical protein